MHAASFQTIEVEILLIGEEQYEEKLARNLSTDELAGAVRLYLGIL